MRDFNRAHAGQMIGHELAIEHLKTGMAHHCHKVCQRHLAGIIGAAEHALATEHTVKADAIKPADKLNALFGSGPAFD